MNKKLIKLDSQKPINLVLSGGGVRGVAHLAVLEYLEENGFTINAISGSSAGALVGAMYLSGISTTEIKKFFTEASLFRFSWIKPLKNGIFDSHKYSSYLKGKVKENFSELKAPLYICATDMFAGRPVYFHQGGNLAKKVIASCAIPGIFSAVEIEDEIFSDGGVMDNFPINPFEKDDLPIVGSYLNKPSIIKKEKVDNLKQVVERAYYLLSHSSEKSKLSQTTVNFLHNIDGFSALNQSRVDELYDFAKKDLMNCVN